jgi:hypothetical protein
MSGDHRLRSLDDHHDRVKLAEKGAVRLVPRLEHSLATAVLVLKLDEPPGVVSLTARLQPAEHDACDADGRAADG